MAIACQDTQAVKALLRAGADREALFSRTLQIDGQPVLLELTPLALAMDYLLYEKYGRHFDYDLEILKELLAVGAEVENLDTRAGRMSLKQIFSRFELHYEWKRVAELF